MSLDVELYVEVDTGSDELTHINLFDANITHNLGKMAEEAGIYSHLWRPEEIDISLAGDLIEPVEKGLNDMIARPAHYRQFEASNGWGLYEHFIPWIQKYLNACKQHPKAMIYAGR